MAVSVGATRQILADAYTGAGSYFSIHTGSPGSTGANEASGGGYQRKQTTWGTGSNGVTSGSQMQFDLPSGTYTNAGLWSGDAPGGIFRDGCAMTSTMLSSPGQILLTPTITIT